MIHFAYSSLPGHGLLGKARGKAARALQRVGLPVSYVGKREAVDTSTWPSRAPLSITHHVLQALRILGPVRLYDWRESVVITPAEGDVLIGHPCPEGPETVFNRACREDPGKFSARIALVPMHYGMAEFCQAIAPALDVCDSILGIMGPYWFDTWKHGPFSHWTPKLIQVDMAVDVAHFPRVKRRFNPKGRRKFLFIGNGEPYKGAHLLSILFGLAAGRHECVWIGADRDLPHLDRRPRATLDRATMATLAEECDVFLTMGVSDANPTTILEAMAWGFPVACTPQSGYYQMPEIRELSTTDMPFNLGVLESFQQMDESTLVRQADQARRLAESHYTFERYTRTVTRELLRVAPSLANRA